MTRSQGWGAILLAAFLLAACAGTPETRSITTLAVVCKGYNSSVRFLTMEIDNDRLSPAQIVELLRVRAVVKPACDGTAPVTLDEALAIAQDGARRLSMMKGGL